MIFRTTTCLLSNVIGNETVKKWKLTFLLTEEKQGIMLEWID